MGHPHEAARHANRATWYVWVGFVALSLGALEFLDLTVYGLAIPAAALILALLTRHQLEAVARRRSIDRADLRAVGLFYVAVVALFRLAFTGFGTDRVAGLFLSFGAALILGVAGPILYTVWHRRRPLSTLGLTRDRLPVTVTLALLFAAIQFSLTLWGYEWPPTEDWVPLLVMSLVVGAFEAVFFRGFVQGRLEASFGQVAAAAVGAGLYALYHVGYGMGADEMVFLFGLGVVYAVAYRLVDNVLVLWPLLTPLGALYANLEAGDIELPWASIAGFADVAAVMLVVVWLAHRHEQRTARLGEPSRAQPAPLVPRR